MHYWDVTGILYIVAEIAVAFTAITGNLIVLVTITRHRSLHSITYLFIGNLAVADICVGIFVTPFAWLTLFGLPSEKHACIFILSAILIFTNTSILILLTIVIERCIAIHSSHALYEKYVTITSARIVILSTWVIGAISGLLPVFGWNHASTFAKRCVFSNVMAIEHIEYFQLGGMTLIPLVIMFSIYLHLYLFSTQATALGRPSTYPFMRRSRQVRPHLVNDMKTTNVFAVITILFAVFWLPINIVYTFLNCPACQRPNGPMLFAVVLSHAYSSVKPIVYVGRSRRFREAVKHMLSNQHSPHFY